jgi:hypothetical protein
MQDPRRLSFARARARGDKGATFRDSVLTRKERAENKKGEEGGERRGNERVMAGYYAEWIT